MKTLLFFLNADDINEITGHHHGSIKYHPDKLLLYEFVMDKIREQLGFKHSEPVLLRYYPSGKKYFQCQSYMIHFNISYSEGCCVFVLSIWGNVGVDIEVIRSKSSGFYQHVMEMTFSDEEQNLVQSDSDGSFFWECWTAKEALVKYSGAGLMYDLKTIIHTAHGVYWPEMNYRLSLIKMRLGAAVISLVADPACELDILGYSGLPVSEIQTSMLPVLCSGR
ncbi:4'-phosphopantetheinyl transferase family protein [Vibrio mangrovi]|uniref:4'-phosphopantetheinyl transferase superfamily protein n=1 Tax=Vibrio mangrovi TaxID=474394 RepID=A0A1Y6IZZ8_9VIBR|nr:4'-phosphopantetheinyl transferase superfamily protein [Vibrio mangrovi]MDW6002911.1 4'-phosphopantetheinyl transferase superfamily protein [Vibrio mangrovi]SMS02400.1 holo-(acyl carrier protein) synthase 2 [Vibrio mangrovi]